MSIGLILIIILVIFLLGGFSGRFGGYGYGYGHGGVGLIGVILIILVVLVLLGRIELRAKYRTLQIATARRSVRQTIRPFELEDLAGGRR